MTTPRQWKVTEGMASGGEFYSAEPAFYIINTRICNCGCSNKITNTIAELDTKANAELIVTAVNKYDDLVEALRVAQKWLGDSWVKEFPGDEREAVVDQITAALAKEPTDD